MNRVDGPKGAGRTAGSGVVTPLHRDEPEVSEHVVVTDKQQGPPPRQFAGVDEFVDRFVLPQWRYRLDTEDVRWCARWWEHTAAMGRLEALWEAFEVMRLDDAPSMSIWYRDHFDVHMSVLTQRDGVFHRCSAERGIHEQPRLWPHEQVPPGLLSTDTTGGNDE
ncbi:DUF4913 domain-containing protein [Allobranchiibius huperziae]|uniref:DUF4913 domain-containing protein n=1 Tax=Allobranchiibius huperziae TaxID=1874116 RepID=A0A853DKH8_9MICO|nr:DUF4913 domain-containing protein [Allobranchiibius huperziae]NYJ76543.1 hypothetical protein [Allobranchiibius huperziae]